jgi:hypothetical protein
MRRQWIVSMCCFVAGVGCARSVDRELEPIAYEDFVEQREQLEASLSRRCCERIGATLAEGYAEAFRREVPAELAARYDERAGAACIAELRARDCTHVKELDGLGACAEIYRRGSRALGEACTTDFDCAQDDEPTACVVSAVTRDGIERACKRYVEVEEGEACEGADPEELRACAPSLWCHPDRSVCVAPAERREPCITGPEWGDTCAVGSVCDRADSGRCVEPRAVGSPCSELEQCEGLACWGGRCREPLLETTGAACEL